MVESDGIIQSESEELQKIIKRIDRNYGYYSTNPMIKGTFDFLKLPAGVHCLSRENVVYL